MKKFFYFALVAIMASASVSCSSSKVSDPIAKGDKEVVIPLSGAQYRSDKKYWRAVQMGTSSDVSMAKKVAMQNARQDLAATVESQMKAVIENYGQNAAAGSKNQNEALYQELTRTVINRTLVGVELVEEKLFKTENGDYRYHVCLQISKDAMQEQLANELSENEILKLEFDRERFKKIYDEELSKFSQGK
ncbi:MAG: LPP20 family lipoprotein [Alistipes sp.]|jgi:hypothetical protein|nr:LPP20 family lipoprotein [Alistipes sp.]